MPQSRQERPEMTQLILRDEITGDVDAGRPSRGIAAGALSQLPTAALELALVEDVSGLTALEGEWTDLHVRAASGAQAFQSFAWCWHWCRHYTAPDAGIRLAIVTGRRDGRLVLVAPFVVQRRLGLRELVWLGEPVTQYGDVLALPEARDLGTLTTVWRFVVGQTRADVANLRKVRADAIVAPLLDGLGAAITATEEAPYLDLTGETSFEGWEARRQPRARKNRKRQARRLGEMGEVRHDRHASSLEAAALARHAVALKRTMLAAKGGISPALADPRFEAFFAAVVEGEGPGGCADVRVLSVGGLPAAMMIMIDAAGTSLLHIAVFDPRFEKCGAGAVLLELAIAEAIRERRGRLDLLAPRHDYKMDFADGIVAVHDRALALTMAGTLYFRGFLAVRRRLKAGVESLPAPVRRAIAKVVG
jgi:CelD/BcsL family acetyltransferase involved in cellulose biosynthesis